MTKNSFVLQTRLNEVVAKLSDKQAGVLFKGILNYAANGTAVNFEDSAVTIAFEFVRQDIDYTAKKYAETCAKRAESGKLGGRPKKANESKKSKCFFEKANESKRKHNDNEDDVDNDNDIKTTKPPLSPLDYSQKPLREPFVRWVTYRRQIKKPLKSLMSLDECYKKLERLSGCDVSIAEKIVNQSIAQGWQGLFELKEQRGNKNEGTDYNREPELGKYAGFGRKIGE